MNIPLRVTPDSMASWLATPEMEWLLAVILAESQDARKALENIPASEVATISKFQGVIALTNRLLKDDFRELLVNSVEVETKKDGGQSLLFSYKLHQYRQGNPE